MTAGTERAPATGLAPALEAFRRQCPILDTTIYLANCSQGPLSEPVREAVDAFLGSWASLGMHWDAWVEEVERARDAFAGLIGAAPEDVAVGTSVSQLVSSVVSALVTRRDGPAEEAARNRTRIVSSTLEFPGVGHAWLGAGRFGWTVDRVERGVDHALIADDFVNMVDDSTAIVSMPHVVYANGSLVEPEPVVRAAHDHGALVFVDAYQSVGTRPIDVRASGADLLAAGALKYLLGTAGVAFLYVSPAVRPSLEPAVTGWFGRVDPFAFDPTTLDYPAGASRFDLGTPPLVNAYAARAGIELVAEVGPTAIRTQIERLSDRALDVAAEVGLRVLGPASSAAKGATTSIDGGTPERARWCEGELRARGIVVAARGRAVRLAPHGFTREDELEHALRELASLLPAAEGAA